jgi:hypothetical protein
LSDVPFSMPRLAEERLPLQDEIRELIPAPPLLPAFLLFPARLLEESTSLLGRFAGEPKQ